MLRDVGVEAKVEAASNNDAGFSTGEIGGLVCVEGRFLVDECVVGGRVADAEDPADAKDPADGECILMYVSSENDGEEGGRGEKEEESVRTG